LAADMPNVSVHQGHPKDLAFKLLPLIVLNAVLPFLVPARWKEHIRKLRESDVALLIGGTTFADSMLFKVPWNLLAALPAYWLGRPVIFLSQTVGPTEKWANRVMAKWTLKRAVESHGRGRQSEKWLRQLGLDNVTYRPDLSFSMHVPDFDEVAERTETVNEFRRVLETSDRKLVGVAPNSIVYEKATRAGLDYIAFLNDVVRTIHEQGHRPVLIPHSYRENISKLHNNDRSLCLALLERIPEEMQCFYVDADLDSRDLRALVGQLHLLVASRFHSMISALSMGVPPITYGWGHHKYIEVLDEFGCGELYAPYQGLNVQDFAERLKRVDAQRDEWSQRIRTALVRIKRDADDLPAVIQAALAHSPAPRAATAGAQDGGA